MADRSSGQAVIIDAVIENVGRDLRISKELGLTLRFAIETHIHADHITGAALIKAKTGAQIAYGGGAKGAVTGADQFLFEGEAAIRPHGPDGTRDPWSYGWLHKLGAARCCLHRRCVVHPREWAN